MDGWPETGNVLVTTQFRINRGFGFKLVHPGEEVVVAREKFYDTEGRLLVCVPMERKRKPVLLVASNRERRGVLALDKQGMRLREKRFQSRRVEVVPDGDPRTFILVGNGINLRPAFSFRGLAESSEAMDMMSPINA